MPRTIQERNPDLQPRADFSVFMHRDRPHNRWHFNRRNGDHRGYIAHGKAGAQTSRRVVREPVKS